MCWSLETIPDQRFYISESTHRIDKVDALMSFDEWGNGPSERGGDLSMHAQVQF